MVRVNITFKASRQKANYLRLRSHPYPYCSALTVCSDIDRCSFDDFLLLHRFLNTEEKTSLGEGLGLEIGDSCWMYSAGSQTDDAFSYFNGTTTEPSPYATCIREGIRAGYIDCLHSYGHFSQYGGFHRRLAEAAIEELQKNDLKLKVWINHSAIHNLQNLLADGLGDKPYLQQASGDKTPVEEYHADITLDYGIRFVWSGPQDTTAIIGQERPYKFDEFVTDKIQREGVGSTAKTILRMLAKQALFRPSAAIYQPENQLLTVKELRDGKRLFAFKRFLPQLQWGRDFGDDLKFVLQTETLDKLERGRGFMLAYSHLGKKRGSQLFSSDTLNCLQELKRRVAAGRIWVTTTAKMLAFVRINRYLSWREEISGEKWFIKVRGIEDPVHGFSAVSPAELAGMTWYTPQPNKTRLIITGKEEMSGNGDREVELQINPADESGQGSVTVPLQPLNPRDWSHLYPS